MYNFNFSSAMSNSPMLGIDLGANTPRTPEILNSLIAMTNPFEYNTPPVNQQLSLLHDSVDLRPSDQDENKHESFQFDNSSQSNTSSSSSSSEGEASVNGNNVTFQMATSISSTPSLQQTRSQLIKAGVKLLIQNKRKNSGSSCDAEQFQPEKIRVLSSSKMTTAAPRTSSISFVTNESRPKKKKTVFPVKVNSSCDESSEDRIYSTSKLELTHEDEDRRRRRRERNKIAATKCRLKKRECINNLMRESESLETQNVDLKNQLKDLREQQRYLESMWQAHQLECNLRKQDIVSSSTLAIARGSNDNQQTANRQNKSKDSNNNKQTLDSSNQLPSFSPLINCNLSFDFY